MTDLLVIEDLRVEIATRRGALTAIDGVSFSIGRGEILGVVGESGAGKSLTGTAVLGLLDPPARLAGGRITLSGQRIEALGEEAMRPLRGRRIGAVLQDPMTSLNPLLTVGRQLVQTIRTHLDLSAAEARTRAEALLAEVGVPAPRERLDSYPHELSGGLRQRVVLALAFSCDPDLVIADEPTTALDVSVQAQVIDVLKRMGRERGTAVMLITHDMGVIAEAADRIAVLYAGRLVEIGPARDILDRPSHPYSRGLMASIPSLRRRRGLDLPQIEGAMPRPGALPPGCAFAPRCPDRMPLCTSEIPPLMTADSSLAACWLVDRHHSARPLRVAS
ncbi:ABC transporter ATP-binding protein [uncultured Enterovirga sp.]|uniref:ABC transporter ATP-binding protein n=1 Tax=uncultured Enterovirga sp. TaxID=2026352 RepID=UPI0035C9F923